MMPVVYIDCPVCEGNAVVKGGWCGNCGGAGIVGKPFPVFKNDKKPTKKQS